MLSTDNQLFSAFQFNTDNELLLIGIIYTALAIVVFPFYAIIIFTLHVKPDFRDNISYKLINIINYCHVAQCACHLLTGFLLIFPRFEDQLQVFMGFIGSTGNNAFLASFVILAILSVARMEIAYTESKATHWRKWMLVSLTLGSLYVATAWLIGCITHNFMLVGPIWVYDSRAPLVEPISHLEVLVCCVSLFLGYLSHVMIIWSIYSKTSKTTQSVSSHRTQIGILIQATVLTVYMSILIVFWHYSDSWFQMTTAKYAIINAIWILFSHLNLILLVSTNRSLRREVRKTLVNNSVSQQTSRRFYT